MYPIVYLFVFSMIFCEKVPQVLGGVFLGYVLVRYFISWVHHDRIAVSGGDLFIVFVFHVDLLSSVFV